MKIENITGDFCCYSSFIVMKIIYSFMLIYLLFYLYFESIVEKINKHSQLRAIEY